MEMAQLEYFSKVVQERSSKGGRPGPSHPAGGEHCNRRLEEEIGSLLDRSQKHRF
jgi:hypothetical protein